MIRECHLAEIDRVNNALCKHFGIEVQDMKAKNKNRLCSMVKSYALYYLHNEKGLSASVLSMAYKLHRRVVFGHISKIGGYITIYSTMREEYQNLCDILSENE